MLTKQDLKAISDLIDKRLGLKFSEHEKRSDAKLSDNFIEYEKKSDAKLNNIFRRELDPIRKDIKKIQKDLNTIISYFDNQYLNHEKRITRLEEHLELPAAS